MIKSNDTVEDETSIIVHAHNHMNKKTWKTVLQWESLNDYMGNDDDDDKK